MPRPVRPARIVALRGRNRPPPAAARRAAPARVAASSSCTFAPRVRSVPRSCPPPPSCHCAPDDLPQRLSDPWSIRRAAARTPARSVVARGAATSPVAIAIAPGKSPTPVPRSRCSGKASPRQIATARPQSIVTARNAVRMRVCGGQPARRRIRAAMPSSSSVARSTYPSACRVEAQAPSAACTRTAGSPLDPRTHAERRSRPPRRQCRRPTTGSRARSDRWWSRPAWTDPVRTRSVCRCGAKPWWTRVRSGYSYSAARARRDRHRSRWPTRLLRSSTSAMRFRTSVAPARAGSSGAYRLLRRLEVASSDVRLADQLLHVGDLLV